jgi:hemerythrin-like domain-containing protein
LNALFETAPSFEHPLSVLKHCHGRIKKQLATLSKLGSYLEKHGADAEAQAAAQAVLRYFRIAAPLHHEDEEINLLPVLEELCQQLSQQHHASQFAEWQQTILFQHQRMHELWLTLAKQLDSIQAGITPAWDNDAVQTFIHLYTEHISLEESCILPLAERLFSTEQMHALALAMQERRAPSI